MYNDKIKQCLIVIVVIVMIAYIRINNIMRQDIFNIAPLLNYLQIFKNKDDDEYTSFFDYYQKVLLMSEKQFLEDFRISKAKFEMLHNKLKDSQAFQYSGKGKPPINTQKVLLVGIWVLATPDRYRSIARRFAISKSSVVTCVRKVINGLLADVCKSASKLPSNETERYNIARDFEDIAGMENVLEALDGCHIHVRAPIGGNKIHYFNRKKDCSILLQGLCDANLFFTNVDVRWPGSVHDARAFRTSDLYQIGNRVCPNNYYFIADSAYPLKTWIMRPYKKTHLLNRQKKVYNKVLSKTRRVIERAFGHLKNKFRRLFYLHMISIKDSVEAIVPCCVLHNISLANDEYARILIFGDGDVQEENNIDLNVVNNVDAIQKRQQISNAIWEL